MRLTVASALCLLMLMTSHVSQAADVLVYGRIILPGLPPPTLANDFYVGMNAEYKNHPGKSGPVIYSKWDMYAYRIPVSDGEFRVKFTAAGFYKSATKYVPCGKADDLAIFPPITLVPLDKVKYGSAKEMQDAISQQVALLDGENDYDVFQYNLASLRYTNRSNRNITEALNQYQSQAQAEAYMAPKYLQRQSLYLQIVARNRGDKVDIAPTPLLALIKDASAFAGIRAYAIRALASDTALPTAVKEDFLSFLRKEATVSSNLLFRPALSALAKIGKSEDKKRIIDDSTKRNDDPERAMASQIAIHNGALDVASLNPDLAPAANAALAETATAQVPLLPSATAFVLNAGEKTPGLDITFTTSSGKPIAFTKALDGDEEVLRVEYPEGQTFGILQFMVHQPGDGKATRDYSLYTDLVVEMRCAEPDKNIDVGIKGVTDPEPLTKFKRTFTDVSTTYFPYIIPLRGAAAQLSEHGDQLQEQRLQHLKFVTEFSFGGAESQTFYIRKIYFARR